MSASSSSSSSPAKILFLHGRGEDAATSYSRTSALRKALGSAFEVVYIDAPAPMKDGTGLMWWDARTGAGVIDSVKYIKSAISKKGPFVGIIGFSQGAGMISHFLGSESNSGISFAVLIGGRAPGTMCPASQSAPPIPVRSLHVHGSADNVVPASDAKALSKLFSGAKFVSFSGGHVVPTGASELAVIKEFIFKCLSK